MILLYRGWSSMLDSVFRIASLARLFLHLLFNLCFSSQKLVWAHCLCFQSPSLSLLLVRLLVFYNVAEFRRAYGALSAPEQLVGAPSPLIDHEVFGEAHVLGLVAVAVAQPLLRDHLLVVHAVATYLPRGSVLPSFVFLESDTAVLT